ncbi:Protein of unknown function [Gryllus bimaculatus]|nr:Protein of unknown function [Gryllus bimaculatus]
MRRSESGATFHTSQRLARHVALHRRKLPFNFARKDHLNGHKRLRRVWNDLQPTGQPGAPQARSHRGAPVFVRPVGEPGAANALFVCLGSQKRN